MENKFKLRGFLLLLAFVAGCSKEQAHQPVAASAGPPSAAAAPPVTATPGSRPPTPAAGASAATDVLSSGAVTPQAAGVLPGPTESTAMNSEEASVPALADSDRRFLIIAAQANYTRREASRLALSRAASPAIKRFAQQVLDAGDKPERDLRSVAENKDVALGADDAGKYATLLEQLRAQHGAEFDAAYRASVAGTVDRESLALYRQESEHGQDPALREVAGAELHALENQAELGHNLARSESVMDHADAHTLDNAS